MLEEMMQNFIRERDNLIDNLTKNLIEHAGFELPKDQSNFEYMMLLDDMTRAGYKIKLTKSYIGSDRIGLYRLEDLHEELIYAYDLEIRVKENEAKIIAIPVE